MRSLVRGLIAGPLWLLVTVVAASGAEPAASNACLVCHNNEHFTIRDPSGQVRSLFVDPAEFFSSVHGAHGCIACHGNLGEGPHTVTPPPPPEEFAVVLAKRPPRVQAAVGACMRCHPAQAREFAESIHGTKAAEGNLDVPLCNDCHGNHHIEKAGNLESAVNPVHVPATCGKCHADQLKMARYDVNTNVVITYETSFHGEKQMLGSSTAAVCTSCHGVHTIRAPSDPLSSVNPANAAQTCGECHNGANAAFAQAFRHNVPSRAKLPLVYWVQKFYTLMIYVTIGAMVLYILLDLVRTWTLRRKGAL